MTKGPLGGPRPFVGYRLEMGINYTPKEQLTIEQERRIESLFRRLFNTDVSVSSTSSPSMIGDGGWLKIVIDEKSYIKKDIDHSIKRLGQVMEDMGFETEKSKRVNLVIV